VQHTESFPQVRDHHHSLPVHPTQLYESFCGLLLLGLLFLARKNVKAREARGEPFFRGEMFLVFTAGYGLLRFLLEIVRDDAERGTYGPHFEPHVIYPLVLMGFALAFWFGLSNIFPDKFRTLVRSVAILVPFGVFMLTRPANRFAVVELVQLSTSQWIAVLTGIAAAAYYRRGLDLAIHEPAIATDLGAGVPELIEMEAALERGEEWPPAEGKKAEEEEAPASEPAETKLEKKKSAPKDEEEEKSEEKSESKSEEKSEDEAEAKKDDPEPST
jgi:phosphatidylglycerol:prolipoprotein diacylglycerol transferase